MKKWPLRIINYLTGFLLLSSIHCAFYSFFWKEDIRTFLYSLLYLPVIVILSEANKRTYYFWQFGLCTGIAAILMQFLAPNGVEQKLSIFLILVAAAFYFYARVTEKQCAIETPEYYLVIIFIFIYFIEMIYSSNLVRIYAIVGASFYFLLCMYKANLREMMGIFYASENLERFPKKILVRNNMIMMGIQTIFVSVGMLAALFVGVDEIGEAVRRFIGKIIGWITSLIKTESKLAGNPETMEGQHGIGNLENAETSAFMEFIQKVIDVLAVFVIAGIIIFILYKIVKKIYELTHEFNKHVADNGDKIEKLYVTNAKEVKKELRKEKQKESLFWDRTPNAKIRKHYKKRVLKDVKEMPKSSMTPTEIEQSLVMEQENKNVFHSLYEKARYGHTECTKEDAEKMLKF